MERCITFRPFLKYTVETKYPELTTKIDNDIETAFTEWIDLSEKVDMDLIDSMITLYKFNSLPYRPFKKRTWQLEPTLFRDYRNLFDDLTDYLLGDIPWNVHLNNQEAYVTHTKNITAEWIHKIYKSN